MQSNERPEILDHISPGISLVDIVEQTTIKVSHQRQKKQESGLSVKPEQHSSAHTKFETKLNGSMKNSNTNISFNSFFIRLQSACGEGLQSL